MRQPSIETDYWELRSAEESHAKYGDSFWIPPLEERTSMQRGQAARLIFDIEGENDVGEVEIQGERMWVIIREKIGDTYIGILDNQPACFDPGDNFYLSFGAEIPFLAAHIIDIDSPPQDWIDFQLSQKPEYVWPRQ